MITVLDLRGKELAVADAARVVRPGALELSRLKRGKAELLAYYFGSGKRNVLVDRRGVLLRGRLRTGWGQSGRRWTVEVIAAPRLLPAPRLLAPPRLPAAPRLLPAPAPSLPVEPGRSLTR